MQEVAALTTAHRFDDRAGQAPYPGLRHFDEEDASRFFGREEEIAAIASLLERQQLTVVHGSSGCGKSSVVRAGVAPLFRLDALANNRQPYVLVFRPTDAGNPLLAFALQLEALDPQPLKMIF